MAHASRGVPWQPRGEIVDLVIGDTLVSAMFIVNGTGQIIHANSSG
jgi:hypothetical protein